MAGIGENKAEALVRLEEQQGAQVPEQEQQQQDGSKDQQEDEQGGGQEGEVNEELQALDAAGFRIYNRMAVTMDQYHEHFRSSWNTLWTACTTGRRPQGMKARQLLYMGQRFTSQLTLHHDMEEAHVFPLLAARMPEFRPGTGPMVTAHRAIHAGLDAMAQYVRACLAGEEDLQMPVLRAKMEPWGAVLWAHLDDEVKALGAVNMRRYWTKEEIRSMPM